MVIGCAGVTLAHGMEHPASGLRDIVHGQGLAALTPAVIDATYTGRKEKFTAISKALGGSSASDCADRVRDLLSKLDLALKLGDLGITEADIPWMTENCQKVSAGNLVNTPVPVTAELISEIYQKSI